VSSKLCHVSYGNCIVFGVCQILSGWKPHENPFCCNNVFADIGVESSTLETKHQTDVEDVAQLKIQLEASSKERKQVAKATRRSELRAEALQAKRKLIARKLAELKDHRP